MDWQAYHLAWGQTEATPDYSLVGKKFKLDIPEKFEVLRSKYHGQIVTVTGGRFAGTTTYVDKIGHVNNEWLIALSDDEKATLVRGIV